MKRMVLGMAIAALIALSAGSTGASAQSQAGDLVIVHQPATAFEREDAHIAAGVLSDCASFYCGQIYTYVVYDSASGATETVSAAAGVSGIAHATIPAEDIEAPELRYHFEVFQVRCELAGGCEQIAVRAPVSGSFRMTVGKAIGF